MGFEFSEGQFNRVEVRAVGWQITQVDSSVGQNPPHALDLVCGQIVQNQCVARMQTRPEDLLKINRKDFTIDRSIDQKRCFNLFMAQRGNEGRTLPMTVRQSAQTTFASGTTAIQTGQLGVQPCLINKDQLTNIPTALLAAPLCPRLLNVGPVLLGGARRFF